MTMRTPGRTTTTPPLKPPRNKKLPEKQPVMTNEHETMTRMTKQDERLGEPERGEPERQDFHEKRARASLTMKTQPPRSSGGEGLDKMHDPGLEGREEGQKRDWGQ